MVPRGTLPLH